MSDNLIALAKKNFDRQKVFNELAEQCASEPIMDIALDKIESLRQQLADSQKQVTMLRDALENHQVNYKLTKEEGRKQSELLAATEPKEQGK